MLIIPSTMCRPPLHSLTCRMRRFLAVLGSFFHSSLLCTLSFHPVPPASLLSFLTSSCHLLLGLPLTLVVSKFIHNTFGGILFPSILCTCPNLCNLFSLTVSAIVGFQLLHKFLYWLIFSNFLFHYHKLGPSSLVFPPYRGEEV